MHPGFSTILSQSFSKEKGASAAEQIHPGGGEAVDRHGAEDAARQHLCRPVGPFRGKKPAVIAYPDLCPGHSIPSVYRKKDRMGSPRNASSCLSLHCCAEKVQSRVSPGFQYCFFLQKNEKRIEKKGALCYIYSAWTISRKSEYQHRNEGTVCNPQTVTATVTQSDLQYATGQLGRRRKR